MVSVADSVVQSEQRFALGGMSWDFYLRCCDELEGSRTRVTYNEGKLEFMVTHSPHEFYKTMLAKLVEMMLFQQRRPVRSGGSLTIRRADLEKGFEPDECWWWRRLQERSPGGGPHRPGCAPAAARGDRIGGRLHAARGQDRVGRLPALPFGAVQGPPGDRASATMPTPALSALMFIAVSPLCFILRSGACARYDGARPYPPKRGPIHAGARAQPTFKIDSCLVSRFARIRPSHLVYLSRLTSRLSTLQSP